MAALPRLLVAVVVTSAAFNFWRAAAQACAHLHTSSAPVSGAYNGTWLLRAGRGSVRLADTFSASASTACNEPAPAAPAGLRLQGAVSVTPTSGITRAMDAKQAVSKGAAVQDSVELVIKAVRQCKSAPLAGAAAGVAGGHPSCLPQAPWQALNQVSRRLRAPAEADATSTDGKPPKTKTLKPGGPSSSLRWPAPAAPSRHHKPDHAGGQANSPSPANTPSQANNPGQASAPSSQQSQGPGQNAPAQQGGGQSPTAGQSQAQGQGQSSQLAACGSPALSWQLLQPQGSNSSRGALMLWCVVGLQHACCMRPAGCPPFFVSCA